MMKQSIFIALLLALLPFLLAQQLSPSINYISSSPSQIINPAQSSYRGGTFIYMQVVGHDPMPSLNKIFVGTFPCIIPADGVTDTFISCETTDSGSNADIYNLPVTIITGGLSFTTKHPNVVSYTSISTPQLYEMFPASGFANHIINYFGAHRIIYLGDGRDMGDVVKLQLGGDLCSRFDVTQPNITNIYVSSYIRCVQSSQQVARKYNITEKLTPGIANHARTIRRSSLIQGEYFEFSVLPTINSISPTNGNLGGQNITIKGTGFSQVAQNNTVLVDGNNCAVSSSTDLQIKCRIAPKNNTLTSLLSSTSGSQQNGYFSGAGLNYARYTISATTSISTFINAVRSSNSTVLGTPQEKGFRTQLKQGNVYGSSVYGQTWNGYFTAPTSGLYVFRGIADDVFSFYISTVPGSTELPANPLIYSNNYQPGWNNFYYSDSATAQASVTLVAGKSYYIQAYHATYGGQGHFKVSVDVPNSDITLPFQAYQVHKIIINSTVQPQVVTYSFTAGTGQINLRLVRYKGLQLVYNVNTTISYGCDADTFLQALNKFNSFSSYKTSVVRNMFNVNTTTANLSEATRVDYVVSLFLFREQSLSNQDFIYTKIGYTGIITKTITTPHSPLITGTFSLSIGGVQFNNLPFDIYEDTLQASIRTIVGYQQVFVDQISPNGPGIQNTLIINYVGVNNAIPNTTVNGAALSGGVTTPSITHSVRRNYSPSITFEPIDFRFLNTQSNTPNVLVSTNGVPSVCTGSCGYSFANYLEVTSLSRSGNTLSLVLTNAANITIALNTISIVAQGLPCIILPTSTLSAITCNLTKNTDETPVLVAGTFLPQVYADPFGYATFASGVSPISVALNPTSLSASTGGDNGGYYNNLIGSGFPTDKSKISITICGKVANIISSTNQNVKFFQPSCTTQNSQNVIIQVGSLTNSLLSFTYTSGSAVAPVISSISPTTQNPAIKGTLTIDGTGFGTNQNQVSVFLSNSSGKVYQLKVISITDTSIKVGLSGGYPGTFTVQITKPNTTGDSIAATAGANTFQYLFSITSISPNSGSYNGGTLLTITGNNFSPQYSDTLVYVGDTTNWLCNIETITKTQITCRTPSISKFYTPGNAQRVVISTKLYQLSSCPGDSCNFTYLTSALSPALTSISASSANAVKLSVNGINFISSVTCSISITSASNSSLVYSVTAISCTNTFAQFNVPTTIPAGNYLVKVRNQIGQSNGLSLIINWALGIPSYNGGGSVMGNIITFTGGSGYPTSLGNGFNIMKSIGGIVSPIEIVSCCTNNVLVLAIPAAPSNTLITILFNGPTASSSQTYLSQSSLTPTINLPVSAALSPGSNTITFTQTDSLSAPITNFSLVSTIDRTNIVPVSFANSSNVFTFTATLNSGSYNILAITKFGYCQVNNAINVSLAAGISAPSTVVSSFAGGLLTITGNNLSPSSYITVNSFVGNIATYTSTAVTYNIPAFVTQASQTAFNLKQVQLIDSKSFTLSSDQPANTTNVTAAFDGIVTTIYGSANPSCWIGVDVGAGLQASINRFRFFPFMNWVNTVNYTLDAVFQGSNDQSSWTIMGTLDQTVHSGWNVIVPSLSTAFRYFRFRHTSQSQCNIAQIQLYGVVLSSQSAATTSHSSSFTYNDGLNSRLFNSIEFRQDRTPTVQSVTPAYGDIFGGYTITLTGTNLGFGSAAILIDKIPCVVQSFNNSQIICLVGARPNIPKTNSFSVTIDGSNSVIVNGFLYVLKWSDSRTWGVDLPPVEGDLVYVPPGMTLLFDTDTPILAGIAVQSGTLIFSNDTDVTVSTHFITLNGGAFIAGTESAPLHSNLKFVMYGNYYGKQQPMFGNKGIGCLNCKFSMYGRPRTPTWTTIASTILPGNTTFTVSENVDWQVGEIIVVASTSFFHYEAEQKKIVSISNRTITVDSPFAYQHVSVVENYGAVDKLVMRAEVGLLTRNIKMMGDSTSAVGKYGSHLMLAGTQPDGLQGHVAYSEFTQCGQPQIVGRYCIHFHMAGEVPTSFVRGNAVHQSHARVVTIHGVYRLLVEKNVGYRVKGHNFFIEDGIETHNTIRYNLAISSLAASNMLQTDTSVASFWVTNPTNNFYGNHAAGGDFYGFWYQVKSNPDGPSATNDVCPIGNPLGYVANNVAHSNIRFGLRIFKLYSRKFPCQPIRKDTNASDPWYDNPSSPSIFQNFTIYKNMEDGVLSQFTGNVIFNNFTIAQNYRAGVQFYVANFTRDMPSVNNSIIIGQSQTNMASNMVNYTNGMAGAITPRSGQSNITNTRFYNYPAGSVLIKTCAFCDNLELFTNLGTEFFIKNVTFNNVNGNYLFMIGTKKDVIYDLDASLAVLFDGNTVNRSSATIVSNWPHIANYQQSRCIPSSTPSKWDNAILCDQTVTIRRIFITNALKLSDFKNQFMKVTQLNSINQVIDYNSSIHTSIQSSVNNMEPMKQSKGAAWSLPYIAGQIYQIWWGSGIDFSHIAISTTPIFTPNDQGVIFKFGYVAHRELFNIGAMRGGKLLTAGNYIASDISSGLLNANTCFNGQYYHNNSDPSGRMLAICQSGKNRTMFQYTEVNAVVCLYACPPPAGVFVKENFVRRWSNATQWPNGTIPKAMDNVEVNGNWTVLLDIDPAPANYLVIDGTLVADDTRDVFISARSIFIRAGNVTAGSRSSPFQHKFTIQVNNTKTDNGWFVDPLVAGNKYIVVTGSLNLFGVSPSTVQTSLTKSASVGDTSIYVASSTDWSIGDTIALSPSYGNYAQYQKVNITAVNSDGSVSFSPALKYNHYGNDSLISTPYGSIDVNTHVGHLNRNIQIIPGPDYSWGVNVLVYGFNDSGIIRVGSVNLDSVQIQDGGQQDTTASALQFLNVIGGNYSSTIRATSFINCKAWCVNINNAKNITFTNNVFYNGWVFGVRATQITNFQFTNNLFIGITTRPSIPLGGELVACFATFSYVNPATDGVLVKDNFCLGSQGHGYAFPHTKCTELETNPFADNTAGSCQIGFIINNIATSDGCKAFSYIKVYASKIGQIMGSFSTKKLIMKSFISVDNQRGVTLKFGHAEGATNHTGIFTDSYISAISRPWCSYCYGSSAINCQKNIGMRMLTVTGNGQTLPSKFGPGFDVICRAQVYENKVYMTNVTFDSYRQSYTGLPSSCKNNFVFQPHPIGISSVADHNLFNVACTNCDTNSYLTATPNNPEHLGWFGGCGDILCTGRSNYLINDWTGKFLPFIGSIIPNNTVIGNNQPGCTFSTPMNAHICNRSDFAVLAYQSTAADFKLRVMWPVNLTYEGSSYSTLTNAWREWEWMGTEPLNHRMGRFLSIIKLNSTYNVSFASMPPIKMQYQIQKRSPNGNASNYIIAKMLYPKPNMIQIKVNGVVQDPILITDTGVQRNLNKSVCGDNIYFYKNYTIHFVVTQDINCLVDLALTDNIQLTTHFAMNVNDFFTNNKLSSFISNLCALLGITDTSRVKVVGVVSGSTIVQAVILDADSSNGTVTGGSNLTVVQSILSSNNSGIASSLATSLNTTVISMTSTLFLVDSTTSETSPKNENIGLIIGVAVAGTVLLVTVVFVSFYCLRKRAKISEQVRQSEEQISHQKDVQNKDSINFDLHQRRDTSEFKINQSQGNNLKLMNIEAIDE